MSMAHYQIIEGEPSPQCTEAQGLKRVEDEVTVTVEITLLWIDILPAQSVMVSLKPTEYLAGHPWPVGTKNGSQGSPLHMP